MRLIDADTLKKELDEWALYITGDNAGKAYDRGCVNFIIDYMQTVDAEPVRHGHWEISRINRYGLDYGGTAYEPCYTCSNCGIITESYVRLDEPIMPEDADFPKYCQYCGAKMDEEAEE